MSTLTSRDLVCTCGARAFRVRLRRDEGVGLAVCVAGGHPSLLFDSRDHWHDLIQDGRPAEVRCRCKAKEFELHAAYDLRDDGDVRSITLTLTCVACRSRRAGMDVEIDYGPTDELIDRPLDPCPEPWLTARRVELTSYWTIDDAVAVVRDLVDREAAIPWLAGHRERPAPTSVDAAVAAVTGGAYYQLYFAPDGRALDVGEQREPWRRLPIIDLSTPTRVHRQSGVGLLFYLSWATEVLVDGRVLPHDPAVIDLGVRLRRRLAARFGGEPTGRHFSSAAEVRRLGLG